MTINIIWKDISKNKKERSVCCEGCPIIQIEDVSEFSPLLLKPDDINSIRIMVITTGPNRK